MRKDSIKRESINSRHSKSPNKNPQHFESQQHQSGTRKSQFIVSKAAIDKLKVEVKILKSEVKEHKQYKQDYVALKKQFDSIKEQLSISEDLRKNQ